MNKSGNKFISDRSFNKIDLDIKTYEKCSLNELEQAILNNRSILMYDEVNKKSLLLRVIELNDNKKSFLLIESGSDVNVVNKNQESPLYLAASNSNYNIANCLIMHGAEVNFQQQEGETALHMAAFYNNTDLINLLLTNGANPFIKTFYSKLLPLDYAKQKRNNESIEILEEYMNSLRNENVGSRNFQNYFNYKPETETQEEKNEHDSTKINSIKNKNYKKYETTYSNNNSLFNSSSKNDFNCFHSYSFNNIPNNISVPNNKILNNFENQNYQPNSYKNRLNNNLKTMDIAQSLGNNTNNNRNLYSVNFHSISESNTRFNNAINDNKNLDGYGNQLGNVDKDFIRNNYSVINKEENELKDSTNFMDDFKGVNEKLEKIKKNLINERLDTNSSDIQNSIYNEITSKKELVKNQIEETNIDVSNSNRFNENYSVQNSNNNINCDNEIAKSASFRFENKEENNPSNLIYFNKNSRILKKSGNNHSFIENINLHNHSMNNINKNFVNSKDNYNIVNNSVSNINIATYYKSFKKNYLSSKKDLNDEYSKIDSKLEEIPDDADHDNNYNVSNKQGANNQIEELNDVNNNSDNKLDNNNNYEINSFYNTKESKFDIVRDENNLKDNIIGIDQNDSSLHHNFSLRNTENNFNERNLIESTSKDKDNEIKDQSSASRNLAYGIKAYKAPVKENTRNNGFNKSINNNQSNQNLNPINPNLNINDSNNNNNININQAIISNQKNDVDILDENEEINDDEIKKSPIHNENSRVEHVEYEDTGLIYDNDDSYYPYNHFYMYPTFANKNALKESFEVSNKTLAVFTSEPNDIIMIREGFDRNNSKFEESNYALKQTINKESHGFNKQSPQSLYKKINQKNQSKHFNNNYNEYVVDTEEDKIVNESLVNDVESSLVNIYTNNNFLESSVKFNQKAVNSTNNNINQIGNVNTNHPMSLNENIGSGFTQYNNISTQEKEALKYKHMSFSNNKEFINNNIHHPEINQNLYSQNTNYNNNNNNLINYGKLEPHQYGYEDNENLNDDFNQNMNMNINKNINNSEKFVKNIRDENIFINSVKNDINKDEINSNSNPPFSYKNNNKILKNSSIQYYHPNQDRNYIQNRNNMQNFKEHKNNNSENNKILLNNSLNNFINTEYNYRYGNNFTYQNENQNINNHSIAYNSRPNQQFRMNNYYNTYDNNYDDYQPNSLPSLKENEQEETVRSFKQKNEKMIPFNKEIYNFLKDISLEAYSNILIAQGYDDFTFLIDQTKNGNYLTDKELFLAGIKSAGVRAKILIRLEEISKIFDIEVPNSIYFSLDRDFFSNINKAKSNPYIKSLDNWLNQLKLGELLENFISNEYYSLELLFIQMISK